MEAIPCGPIVEILGDEMAQILWDKVKEKLVMPYLSIETIEFDLSLINRDQTENQIVYKSIEAIKKYKVCVKCATKTADSKYVEKYNLSQEYPSVNSVIRNELGGVTVREPVLFPHATPKVTAWHSPVTTVFLSEEDIYECKDIEIDGPGLLEVVYTPIDKNREEIRRTVFKFEGKGVAIVTCVTEKCIENFAIQSFDYSLKRKCSLYFSAMQSVLPIYDGRFSLIFNTLFKRVYRCKFIAQGLTFENIPINRMGRYILLTDGNFIWALKNYDGDIFSSFVASAYGMVSSLFLCRGKFGLISETIHGPPVIFERDNAKGIIPGFNPTETIAAWALGLKYRAKLDQNEKLLEFAKSLETAYWETIKSGFITTELLAYINIDTTVMNSYEFIDKVATNLDKMLNITSDLD